jgi:hypothetical protein
MKYTRGQNVIVEDFRGDKVPQRVWEDAGDVVFVTSDELFSLLEIGQSDLHPVGVPKADVSPAVPKSSE